MIKIKPFIQKTDSHCGPAVIQALLLYVGIKVSQDRVVSEARVKSRLMSRGMRPDQMIRAIRGLAPEMEFWLKQNSRVSDIDKIINQYHYPVAINWQGLFYESAEEEKKHILPSDGTGHYSVVVGINPDKDLIVTRDGYSEFAMNPRKFSLKWWVRRWWDVTSDENKRKGRKKLLCTRHLMFLVTPKQETFPQKLHCVRVEDFKYLTKKSIRAYASRLRRYSALKNEFGI